MLVGGELLPLHVLCFAFDFWIFLIRCLCVYVCVGGGDKIVFHF